MRVTGPASAYVDIVLQNNETFQEAYQFDPPGPTGCTGPAWVLAPNARMDIKGNDDQPVALLSITSGAGQIIIDDAVNRILHFNVPESVITAVLVPGSYVYDLVMFDGSSPPIRTVLMHGRFQLGEGITGG